MNRCRDTVVTVRINELLTRTYRAKSCKKNLVARVCWTDSTEHLGNLSFNRTDSMWLVCRVTQTPGDFNATRFMESINAFIVVTSVESLNDTNELNEHFDEQLIECRAMEFERNEWVDTLCVVLRRSRRIGNKSKSNRLMRMSRGLSRSMQQSDRP